MVRSSSRRWDSTTGRVRHRGQRRLVSLERALERRRRGPTATATRSWPTGRRAFATRIAASSTSVAPRAPTTSPGSSTSTLAAGPRSPGTGSPATTRATPMSIGSGSATTGPWSRGNHGSASGGDSTAPTRRSRRLSRRPSRSRCSSTEQRRTGVNRGTRPAGSGARSATSPPIAGRASGPSPTGTSGGVTLAEPCPTCTSTRRRGPSVPIVAVSRGGCSAGTQGSSRGNDRSSARHPGPPARRPKSADTARGLAEPAGFATARRARRVERAAGRRTAALARSPR